MRSDRVKMPTAYCDTCGRADLADGQLVVLLYECDYGIYSVECQACHRATTGCDDDMQCATLEEYRAGTLSLGWWELMPYWDMEGPVVEDGADWLRRPWDGER